MQEATLNEINTSSKWTPLRWDSILIMPTCGLIHKISLSIHMFSTTFYLSSNCVYKILVEIFLRWPKSQNGSAGVHLNVDWSADFRFCISSSLLSLRSFIVHYENFQSRRNMLLCETSDININTGLKCWPCRGTTPWGQLQVSLTEHTDICLKIGCISYSAGLYTRVFWQWPVETMAPLGSYPRQPKLFINFCGRCIVDMHTLLQVKVSFR